MGGRASWLRFYGVGKIPTLPSKNIERRGLMPSVEDYLPEP